MSLFAFGIGTTELIILAGIALLLFGTRLPKVMRSLGEGIVEFKRGVQGLPEDSSRDGGRVEGHR
ncbi:MAG: twin-arginine translocase TatA/TatE family subunit [Planctomycetaceae bacterium]